MKKILSILFATMLVGQAWARTSFEIGNLEYYVTDEENHYVSVAKGSTVPSGELEIPSEITYPKTDGVTYTITGIYSGAFRDCADLTSVTIPNSVTSIGYDAFGRCTGLTSVTIPNSVTEIGVNAFSGCTGLTSVTIPNSVTKIGNYAFQNCSGLTSVTIPNSVTEIGESTFQDCLGLTSVAIPNSITSIGKKAFYNCSGLTSVTIPNSVTEIGKSAFQNCLGLTSVTIPNSVTSIGEEAFCYCIGLTSITIPNSVTEIGEAAFSSCTGLTSVTIPNSVTLIDRYVFSGCSGLASITIPNSVTKIGNYAFQNCSGLTSVTIPNSVTEIGGYAFYRCTGLTSVTIPNSVTWIGNVAFSMVKNIVYKGTLSGSPWGALTVNGIIDDDFIYADAEKTQLTAYVGNGGNITIPNTVTSIGDFAFYNCIGLTSVTIPNTVTSIGESAFFWVKNIAYEGSASGSPWGAFTVNGTIDGYFIYADAEKTQLTAYVGNGRNVTIPNSVTEIGVYAFYNCNGLTSVTIPNSVTTIGNSAFYYVKNIVYEGTASGSPWGALTVNGTIDGDFIYADTEKIQLTAYVGNGGNVTIPNSVTSICAYAFQNCNGLTSVTIPNSVTSISNYAFCDCDIATIYCEASNRPNGWGVYWKQANINVVWGGNENQGGNEQGNENQGGNEQGNENQGGENNPSTTVTESAANAINIYAYGNTIIIENATDEIRVYDAMGRLVVRRDDVHIVSTEICINTPGVYVVKVGNVAKRVMVN